MFDFRYHAISLAAVFLALAVGLLLGIAVGDRQLVSSARNELEENLKEELSDTRAEARTLREDLARARLYEAQTFPVLVDDRLAGRRVAVVFLNGPSEEAFGYARDAVLAAGGDIATSYTIRSPLDLEEVAEAAAGTRYEAVLDDDGLLGPLGERIGRQIVQPGRFLRQMRRAVIESASGDLQAAEAVVVVRGEPPEEPDEDAERTDAFESGLAQGLGSLRTPVVGVELTTTEPSQVPWYQAHGLASVDNLDHPPGGASLVYALAGEAQGAYGIKPTRDAYLPDALTRGP